MNFIHEPINITATVLSTQEPFSENSWIFNSMVIPSETKERFHETTDLFQEPRNLFYYILFTFLVNQGPFSETGNFSRNLIPS